MQMIDVMKRLAELDAQNPNVVKTQGVVEGSGPKEKQHDKYVDRNSPESKAKVQAAKDKMDSDKKAEPGKKLADKIAKKDVAESLSECGMMGGAGQYHSPASINMTADSGAELTGMLRDIMQLAGRPMQEPIGGDEPIGVSVPAVSTALEPAGGDDSGDMSPADTMRSVIDKLNPMDQDDGAEDDDDQEEVNEYDNEPNPQGTGYGSMTPTGDDLASKGDEAPKVNGGGNPMQKTMEQITKDLFADYQQFISEN